MYVRLIFVVTEARISGITNMPTFSRQLLHVIGKIDGEFLTFTQDSAEVHRPCETINLLACNFAKCSRFKKN